MVKKIILGRLLIPLPPTQSFTVFSISCQFGPSMCSDPTPWCHPIPSFLSHPTPNLPANSVVSVFKINAGSGHFSPSLLWPTWGQLPSSLSWIISTASLTVSFVPYNLFSANHIVNTSCHSPPKPFSGCLLCSEEKANSQPRLKDQSWSLITSQTFPEGLKPRGSLCCSEQKACLVLGLCTSLSLCMGHSSLRYSNGLPTHPLQTFRQI